MVVSQRGCVTLGLLLLNRNAVLDEVWLFLRHEYLMKYGYFYDMSNTSSPVPFIEQHRGGGDGGGGRRVPIMY